MKYNFIEGLRLIKETLNTPGKGGKFYCIHDFESVNWGEDKDVNLFACNALNIPTSHLNRRGGCMVFEPGDITVAGIFTAFSHFNSELVEYLLQKLQGKGLNATSDHNDIIIDNQFKVSGCTKRRLEDGRTFCAMHISINSNSELISLVCLKPKGILPNGNAKQPAGLSQWGILTPEVEEWIEDFMKGINEDE